MGSKGFNNITEEDIEHAVENSDKVKKKLERIDEEADKALEVSKEDLELTINV